MLGVWMSTFLMIVMVLTSWIVLMILMVLTSWIVLMLAQGILSSILILSACHSPFNALLNIIVAPFCHHHYIIRRTAQTELIFVTNITNYIPGEKI